MPPNEQNLADLIITEEKIGFEPNELLTCAKCGRSNAPNRLKCMYCAAELEVSDAARENVRVDAKRPEAWEPGINIICLRVPENAGGLNEIAASTGIDEEFLSAAIESELPLPLARVGSATEAAIIAERLAAYGIETTMADDKELDSYRPRRVRSVEIEDHELAFVLFNSDEVVRLNKNDIILIVTGKIFESEIEATELRKFRKAEHEDQVMTKSRSSV
ncbi:MAG TPA: hypothetical protein VJL58_11325, partial [Pyrinomonadaceae bacterium]|nr:hypothetical protein [Pyrinomonadaceae bacterium]